jgi:hypothetical protein
VKEDDDCTPKSGDDDADEDGIGRAVTKHSREQ